MQKSNLPQHKKGQELKAKIGTEFRTELLCWPQNVSLQPHTSYIYRNNVHHLCSAP